VKYSKLQDRDYMWYSHRHISAITAKIYTIVWFSSGVPLGYFRTNFISMRRNSL